MPRPPMEMGTYGSINTKREGDRWRAFTRARDLDGVVRQVSASGPSKAKAETALKGKLRDRFVALEGDVRPDMTLEALSKVWLAKAAAGTTVGESSLETYEWAVGVLLAHAGKVRVREATVPMVDRLITALHAESPSKARMVRTVLGRMLGLAAKQGAIAANPVKSLDRLSRGGTAARALDVEGVAGVRAAVRAWQNRPGPGPRDKDLGDIVDLHLATGCRIGEVLALSWADVDFDAGTVAVTSTLRHIKGRGLVRRPRPKTKASEATMPLPAFALEVLARRAELSGADPASPVFPSRAGSWKSPNNVRRQWREAREGSGFEWVTPKTFRKTVGTMVRATHGLGVASQVLRHASEKVTEEHYIAKAKVTPDVSDVLDLLARPADTEDTEEQQAG